MVGRQAALGAQPRTTSAYVSDQGRVFYREDDVTAQATHHPAGRGHHRGAGVPDHPDLHAAQPAQRHPQGLPRLRRRHRQQHRLERHRLGQGGQRQPHRVRPRRPPEHVQHRRARLHPGGVARGRRGLRPLRRRRHHPGPGRRRHHPLLDLRHHLRHPRGDHQRGGPPHGAVRQLPRAWPGSAPSTTSTPAATTSPPGSSPTAPASTRWSSRRRPRTRPATPSASPTTARSRNGSTPAAGYYFGTSAWGPIMGGSMNRAVSQWSQGEYAGANNHEDDLAVIQNHGLPLRADDHPGTTTLGSQASYAVSGVIGTRTDTDYFAVTLPCTTTLSVNAKGIGKQAALDLSLTVLDGNGHTVATQLPGVDVLRQPTRLRRHERVGEHPQRHRVLRAARRRRRQRQRVRGRAGPTTAASASTRSPRPVAPRRRRPPPRRRACRLPRWPRSARACRPPLPPTRRPHRRRLPRPPRPHRAAHPTRPKIGWVTSGPKHGAKTATVRWYPPATSSEYPVCVLPRAGAPARQARRGPRRLRHPRVPQQRARRVDPACPRAATASGCGPTTGWAPRRGRRTPAR